MKKICQPMEHTMEDLEQRIRKLEKKYRTLKYSVLGLFCFAAYAGLSGATMNTAAFAQQKPAEKSAEDAAKGISKEEAGIPVVVEAEVFLLKDSSGNIRGVWTADGDTTSFAMMHKDKFPIAAMAVDRKNASLSMTDVYGGKISLGLADSVRSVSITDDSKKNNIYLGLTGSGEAAFDMVSTNKAGITVDGKNASIDLSGDTSIVALTETVGSAVALKAQPATSALTFLDFENKATVDLTTIDGKSQLMLNSPATKDTRTLTTAPEEVMNLNEETVEEVVEEKTEDKTDKKDANDGNTKEKDKVVNLKTYSPFSK